MIKRKSILINQVILFFALLHSTSPASAEAVQSAAETNIQACVLYSTDKNSSYPIPREKCVEVPLNINCNEQVVDSKTSNKIWRSYPEFKCTDPNIKTGLSERYLLEGIDE